MASVDLQEKANFTRLSRLLVDKGTEALRNTFDGIHPPTNLPAVLAANRTFLLKLKPRVINDPQWDLLYPPSGKPPDSKTFDVTLLTVLFRNICGLPKTGWGAVPVDTDRSMQANIARIKSYRNDVYAHVTSTQVDNATFESLWQKITQAFVELNIPQKDVDELKICTLGPEEEVYVGILKDLKSQEEESLKVLKSFECSMNRFTQSAEEKLDSLKQLCRSAFKEQNNRENPQSSITRPVQVSEDINLDENRGKENDDDLLRKLAKHNFKSKIRSKVKFFLPGTREWLLKKVDKWFIGNKHESNILLLTAGPGFGKSVFSAKICENFKKRGKLAACHFCDFSESNLRDPMMMLQSLASQICDSIVGFKEKLLDQLKSPHKVRSLKDAFGIYLRNPLNEFEVDEPSLVVIDGLDESGIDDKNDIVKLIADYFPDLPDCIKVLVTSRPEISVAKLQFLETVNIKSHNARNNSDLKIFLKSCLPSLLERKADGDSGVCEGSFLYAFYAQSELQKRNDLDKMTLNEIIEFVPRGLDSIYQAYFQRLEDELKAIMRGNLDVLRVLEMLVAPKKPLPLTFVTRALGFAPDCRETKNIINKVNVTVSCLLYVSDDLVTIFHKSVIDWLLAKGYQDHEYTVKVSDGDKSLWLICEQVFKEIKNTVCSGHDLSLTNDVKYALDYGLQHLVACNMTESFFWLVDVVIIHLLLTVYPQDCWDLSILKLWEKILQCTVVISDELRARISWHITEIFLICGLNLPRNLVPLFLDPPAGYLQSVLAHSPEGYFSANEKEIAESLLSKVPRFVDINSNHEVEVMPLAVVRPTLTKTIKVVSVSKDKTIAAVALENGTILVVCVPRLVELWQYSTEYESISCCTFAPDDSFVLFGKLETALNIAERKEVPFFHGNKEKFMSCAFSPNGKRLISSNGSSMIKLWNVANHSLLTVLCADVPVNWCSFSMTGLFIIGNWKHHVESDDVTYTTVTENSEDSIYWVTVCAWNSITWQRCDQRNLRDHELKPKKGKAFQSELCKRCFLSTFELPTSGRLDVEPCKPSIFWFTGIFNGVECIFALHKQSLSVIENTHFTTLAAWNFLVDFSYNSYALTGKLFREITAIENDLWLYADFEKLIVFRTLVPKCPTRVLWTSFSLDGSQLATCTSGGCINIWNVDTKQVEQRFKRNHDESPFACCWSKEFLFVLFGFCDRISSLSKYPMDVNLKILFSQRQQVSLCHLVDEIVSLSTVVDFSEGFLSFECGERTPVKVLDVNGVGGPRMVTLPGIEAKMSITVSPGGSFIFGGGKSVIYVWKKV